MSETFFTLNDGKNCRVFATTLIFNKTSIVIMGFEYTVEEFTFWKTYFCIINDSIVYTEFKEDFTKFIVYPTW